MPSSDHDPTRDDGRLPERWSGGPSHDAMHREAERRSSHSSAFDDPHANEPAPGARGGTFTPPEASRGGSAYGAAREVRSAGPSGPGNSYGGRGGSGDGGYGGGSASGRQAYGHRPVSEMAWERPAPEAWDDRDGPPPEPPRSPDQGSGPRMGSAWSRQAERRNAWTDAPRGHGSPQESKHGPNWQRSLDREDDTQFDADYRQWRDEQMRLLDRDYAQWRKERYRKFAEEFSQWRSQRLQQSNGQASTQRTRSAEGQPPPLGDITPLGTPAGTPARTEERERPPEPERERSGGLLGSLLGAHGDRHKP